MALCHDLSHGHDKGAFYYDLLYNAAINLTEN